ncbi:hypothetical protein OO010_09715 [Flavobacteriaceae bacterium KMM 6898]|nr:hypothetical protein [Flavobacteriaceae bacterium KMM 6898]
MKSIKTNLIILLTLCFGLTSCSSQKALQTDFPFAIGKVTVQEWMGGREESGTGSLVTVPVSVITKEVRFLELYYKGQIAQVTMENNEEGFLVQANFANASNNPDLVMHADPKKEVGNQPPSVQGGSTKDFPFELASQEAVLSYVVKNRVKYVKISGIKEKAVLIYSTKPKN